MDKKPAGLAICFEGFSTFAWKPLLNIHDFAVASEFRKRGLAKRILEKVELAHTLGCCKIILEVLEGNKTAQIVYKSCGFARVRRTNGSRAFLAEKALTVPPRINYFLSNGANNP